MKHSLVMLVILLVGYTGASPAGTIAYRDHPKVYELEMIYERYIDAMAKGDVDAYFQTRTADVVREVGDGITSEMLRRLYPREFNPRDARFLRYDSAGSTARLIYRRQVDDNSEWMAVMFHNESGEWKIGKLVGMRHLGAHLKDNEGINSLLEHIEARVE